MKQMGEQLRVRTLLEGTLLRLGNKLRVQVQLANVTDGYVFWSESYEQSGTDTLALQLEVVKKVEEALSQLHASGDLWGGVHALGRAAEQR
jgi:TolB-like protein